MTRTVDRPVVAIHQPNYLPWLGYFHKIAQADVFVFLETVQFSKGSYTNRVQILRDGKPVWLTQPIKQTLGQSIEAVGFAEADWPRRHLDTLHGAYRGAKFFRAVFPNLEALLIGTSQNSLAAANRHIVEGLIALLGLQRQFIRDGALGDAGLEGGDRLIALVKAVAPGAVYLSGKGGATYQDDAKFAEAGIELRYSTFTPCPYPQINSAVFVPGLSIVDVLFSLGVDGTRALIEASD